MTQTFNKLWGSLRAYKREIQLGAVTGVFLGLIAAGGQTTKYQAHFFQRAYQPSPDVWFSLPEEIVTQESTAMSVLTDETLRPAAMEVASSAATTASSFSSSESITPLILEQTEASSSSLLSSAISKSSAISSQPAQEIQPSPEQVNTLSSFPTLERTVHPVSRIPNWGAMRTPDGPDGWNRNYRQMTPEDFVSVPAYDLAVLTIPMSELTNPITDKTIPQITANLYYSTLYDGAYDVNGKEGEGDHDGVDLKLALGQPIRAIGGGNVYDVRTDDTLGLHVLIEHRLASGERYLSIYGHLGSVSVTREQEIKPGQSVGTVGMTGNTSGPHLHLALHKAKSDGPWNEYDKSESVHPMHFIATYGRGE
jgi:murein DD-endopeptidase MepM/ murein hydrolase activator NlpD